MLEWLLQWVLSWMPKPIQSLFARYESVLRYCYYGAWTTLVSALAKLAGKWCFALAGHTMMENLPNLLNTTISWVIAVVFAFVVNKKYVFMSKTNSLQALLQEMLLFFSARLVSFFLELGMMWLTTCYFQWNYLLMIFITQIFILAINYVFSKLVVFRKGNASKAAVAQDSPDANA